MAADPSNNSNDDNNLETVQPLFPTVQDLDNESDG